MSSLLEQIREGMKVYDRSQAEIGRVEVVKFSDEDPDTPEPEVVDVNPIERQKRQTLLDIIAALFRDDALPEELRERLLREGFVRVDATGLLQPDRYVLPDQIASVSGDRVMLKVDKAELIVAR
jgi:hypothetical protein